MLQLKRWHRGLCRAETTPRMLLRGYYGNNCAMTPGRSIGYALMLDKTRSEVSRRFSEPSGARQLFGRPNRNGTKRLIINRVRLQLEKPSKLLGPISHRSGARL